MKVTREELIYIHKRIWNSICEYIHYHHSEISIIPIEYIKDSCIQVMMDENEVSQNTLEWVDLECGCVFCALFSLDFCKNCPLGSCIQPESLYQLVLKGSEEACIKIRDSIDYADIPEYIEIPKE